MTDIQLILIVNTIALCVACATICVLLMMCYRIKRQNRILVKLWLHNELKNNEPFSGFESNKGENDK